MLVLSKTFNLFRVVPWDKKAAAWQILLFQIVKVSYYVGRKDLIFHKFWHPSYVFEDDNMLKALQYFRLPILYAPNVSRLKKISFILIMEGLGFWGWLGRENEENVVRTRSCCGCLPPLGRVYCRQNNDSTNWTKKTKDGRRGGGATWHNTRELYQI